MTLDDFKNLLYKERQAVDAIATTIKSNVVGIAAIIAALAIPAVPAIFSGRGAYVLTRTWGDGLSWWLAVTVAIAIEGAGLFLSWLATKTYSVWRKKLATAKEVMTVAWAVVLYALIVIALISFSDAPKGLKIIMAFVPLLGIAFYIGMGFETDLANRLDEAADEKRQKAAERKAARLANHPNNRPATVQKSLTKDASLGAILEYLDENPDASLSEIGRQIGRPKSTTGNYVNELMTVGKLYKNGSGWKVSE